MLQGRFAAIRKALGLLGMDASEDQIRRTAEELADVQHQQKKTSQWTRGVYGEVNGVRNLRVAETARLRRGRAVGTYDAVELDAA